ncbi:myosin heavy chain, striated muscle-like isoform X3 [Zingiber officinale]|uniref:myosin heavy chain, striated muscle-like isoform X3 n=1 Tax=Zingiber officinale TaxID=94328 RepID=UPI001C4D648B|nr:myosin heavy chain, striated muscle-like isoform X3 [Zingiber officinale]
MAFPSTFQERLQQMEATRNQRLLLLQAEKELHLAKSQLLSKKIEDLRREECRCLLLKRRGTELACQILASKSEIDALEARHQAAACEYRDLKREIEELEEKEKTRDEFYNLRMSELEEFKESTRRFLLDNRDKVQKLQDSVSELKSTLNLLQGSDGYMDNGRIAAGETKKSELLAEKEKLEKYLISSDHLRTLLQKQLHKMLISQDKKKTKALTKDQVEK